ncbi:hypothetical protein NKOR_01695 [Candidatus Nitrosopumilus koreensis AR1]|uniref:DUF1059 domain-containing protein n=1 Tax=Candidatus Nitrosopumilus koreensis AR1 TaxID=1229908 RepID=K0B5M1_9ARCH|nr:MULTISPECIES: hypothetical protein [Nitrosopumilus]AFS80245.1 hypothetical protein NKOR_01695 [Candidatus Nitrosopumilus koreensis AR1]
MNFNCVFSKCDYKQNNITEQEFLEHLENTHHKELQDTAEKENLPLDTVTMMTVSNSKVFINS